MACRLEAHEGVIGVVAADRERPLGMLLVELGGRIGEAGSDYSAINTLLGVEGTGLLNATLLLNGLRVVAVCLEAMGSEYRGDEAASRLRSLHDKVATWGIAEAFRLSRSQYTGFTSVYADASLTRPRHLYWLAGYEEERSEEEAEEARLPGDRGEDYVSGSLEAPDLFMARIILLSKIIRYRRRGDPVEFHREARRLSLGDKEAFYRLAIFLRNEDQINIFYYGGRPCVIIRFQGDIAKARGVTGDVVALLQDIDRKLIESVSIQRVECPDCLREIQEACAREAGAGRVEAPIEQEEKQEPEPAGGEETVSGGGREDLARPRTRRRFPWFRRK